MLAYLALGSNLGDRFSHLKDAVDRLSSHESVRVVACSGIYETAPLGPPQGRYYNATVAIETELPPDELLALCRAVEDAGGRTRDVHWGPRTIDVDILDAGGLVSEDAELVLPHPEVMKRTFVLVPLLDIAPEWRHPVTGETAGEALGALGVPGPDDIVQVKTADEWCRTSGRPENEPAGGSV